MDKQKAKDRLLFFFQFLLYTLFKFWYVWAAMGGLAVGALLLRDCRDDRVAQRAAGLHLASTPAIDISPEEIRAIRRIGQWEFLSVQTEELAELHEPGLLGDKQLARIYTGTLRIGIDMSRAGEAWFEAKGDTAVITLPRPHLLDSNFIDETRTRTFYESGQWDADARERLYRQARTAMMARCLSPANMLAARQSATAHFSRLFFGLGYKHAVVIYK